MKASGKDNMLAGIILGVTIAAISIWRIKFSYRRKHKRPKFQRPTVGSVMEAAADARSPDQKR